MGVMKTRTGVSVVKTPTWLRAVLLLMIVGLVSGSAPAGRNLVTNGDFERGVTKQDEPIGWHTRITSYTSLPEYEDPANKKGRTGVVRFRCPCGREWGTVRPWVGLLCPQCKQMVTGLEESAAKYEKNYESVKVVPRGGGRAVGVKMTGEVAGSQGVRVLSALMPAERGAGYEMGFEAIATSGVSVRVFLEGFRLEEDDEEAKEFIKTLPSECNPYKLTGRLKRVARLHINAQQPGNWTFFKERTVPPKRSEFDFMMVNLYCYNFAGEAGFDNVQVRKITPAEVEKIRSEKNPKEDRFK